MASAPFPAHQDVPGSLQIGKDPRKSGNSHLHPQLQGKSSPNPGSPGTPGVPGGSPSPRFALLPDPAWSRTPPALTSFRSSLERSGRGSTWEDAPGEGASGEETRSTCGEENHRHQHPQKAADEKASCPPCRPPVGAGGGEPWGAARRCRGAGVRLGKAVVSRHCPILHRLLPASPTHTCSRPHPTRHQL